MAALTNHDTQEEDKSDWFYVELQIDWKKSCESNGVIRDSSSFPKNLRMLPVREFKDKSDLFNNQLLSNVGLVIAISIFHLHYS